MKEHDSWDVIVVGAGPNGLAAAIALARRGCSVLVYEAAEREGGGTRSAELTLPGFIHDVCSAIHPLGTGSPFFRTLPLASHGLEWIHPSIPLAHPFDDGAAAILDRSIDRTAATLDGDGDAYRRLMAPLLPDWDRLAHVLLNPLRLLRHPIHLARFGLHAIRSARGLGESRFEGERARGLLAGMAAHSLLPLERRPSAAFAMVLALAGHAVGWPVARGGSQQIARALLAYLESLGGRLVTGARVDTIDDLPPARALLLDITPRQLLRIAGHRLPARYRRRLERYRYGPGVFKIDWALDGPVPWTAAACCRAGTVHLGGTMAEIAEAERAAWRGLPPERPFVLIAQQSLFDPTRVPEGKHTLWGYCHLPHGSEKDMTGRVEAQIERFAPGFRERVLARHRMGPARLEAYNPNYIGGDINGGVQDLRQLFTRPVLRLIPYSTPLNGLYLCSSATPPGGGVHGMCGYYAALAAYYGSLR